MRLMFLSLAALAISLSVLTGCQDAAKPVNVTKVENKQPAARTPVAQVDEHGHDNSAPRITVADAKKDFDSGSAVFVDTRVEAVYKQEHIKGAINIPETAPPSEFSKIPKGKKVIAYCS